MKHLTFQLWLFTQISLWATPLWNGTVSGMSPAEVTAKFEKAIVPDKPSHLFGGATEKVHIPVYRYLERDFQVHFYFVEDGLSQVTLELKQTGKRPETEKFFQAACDDLSRTLGAPDERKAIEEGRVNRILRATWEKRIPVVSVIAANVGIEQFSDGGYLNINFQLPHKDQIPR